MKTLLNYFTEDQLPELEKIVGILATGDVQLAGTLLEAVSLYTPVMNYLIDEYISSPLQEARNIINIFGYTLYYGLFYYVQDLPDNVHKNLYGTGKYVLALKSRVVKEDKNLVVGVYSVSDDIEQIYNNMESELTNIEKALFYAALHISNQEDIDYVPNNIKHLNIEAHYSQDIHFSDESILDLTSKKYLQTLFLRYGEYHVSMTHFPSSLQYLRCSFVQSFTLLDFLSRQFPTLKNMQGLTIELCAGLDCFVSNRKRLRDNGFLYDDKKQVFVVKI